jgi:hypothetical protein
MDHQLFVLAEYGYLSRLKFGNRALPNRDHIPRPECGDHAGPTHHQPDVAAAASYILDQFATRNAA